MPEQGTIRVGLLGANPDRGWGSSVHIPAIHALEAFRLEAVATTRQDSADETARRYGARLAFSDPREIVAHPDIDLVSITVKAPEHYRLAMLALEAGKHVYCEWPLAANLAQAQAMRDLAARKNVKAIVGLQARAAPAVMFARDLISQGYAGRVVAVRLLCSLPRGGDRHSLDGLYVIDKINGASTLAIQGGHAIDALRYVAGEFAGLSATIATQFTEVEVIETGERRPKDSPDQVLVNGKLRNGAVVSICINGGAVAGFGIDLKIFGTEGTLSIAAQGTHNFQMSELELTGAKAPARQLAPLEIPTGYDPQLIAPDFRGRSPSPGVEIPRATIVNVANLYRRIGDAILHGAALEPDFATGTQMHELLDAMETASATGQFQKLTP